MAAPLAGAAFRADLRARSGWDAATLERLLRHGGVHLDGCPHGADDLPAWVAAGTLIDLHALAWEPEPVVVGPERVLAEGPDWIAVDKPAHLPVQATRASRLHSLEAALRRLTGRAGLVAVHRLDRETSGVCLFASDAAAAARLGRAFREGTARRRYLARVAPPPEEPLFEVLGWIGRVLHPTRYAFALRADPHPGWRWSRTRFERLAVDAAGSEALVAAEPATGRTHQIRVHLAAAGTPIVGDPVYGGAPAVRLRLHAAELAFEDGGEEVVLRAPAGDALELRCDARERTDYGPGARKGRSDSIE